MEQNREITLEFVRVTEAAALSASRFLGRGNKEMADGAAVDAMRGMLDLVDMRGTVIIGEGEKDKAPMLYIGEKIGNWSNGSPEVDIAVDPIDGTRLVAYGLPNAISVIAAGPKNSFMNIPTYYLKKLAVGPELSGKLDINAPVRENLKVAAAILGLKIGELTVVVLNRERHQELIEEIRIVGARIKLINDGDIAAAIATALEGSGVDMYMGIGGATEAILAAAALKSLDGEIQCKFWEENEEEKERASKANFDLDKKFKMEDLVSGENIIFSATGITNGDMVEGIKFSGPKAITHSIVMRSKSKTIRYIKSVHDLRYKKIPLKSLDKEISLTFNRVNVG